MKEEIGKSCAVHFRMNRAVSGPLSLLFNLTKIALLKTNFKGQIIKNILLFCFTDLNINVKYLKYNYDI